VANAIAVSIYSSHFGSIANIECGKQIVEGKRALVKLKGGREGPGKPANQRLWEPRRRRAERRNIFSDPELFEIEADELFTHPEAPI
jgi:hypothetical protein